MILYYGETYYMKYGFLPENKSRNLEIINIRINEKTIKLENIIEFTKNNLFPEETNKDFIKLCKKIVKKNNKLKYFLEEIKFIKDKGKKNCNYFFSSPSHSHIANCYWIQNVCQLQPSTSTEYS